MKVTLDWFEVSRAAQVGVQRQVMNMAQGARDGHRFGDNDPWGTHIAGALAECAFAKAQNTYWLALAKDYKSLPGDVGMDQVRSTARADGCLLLHPDDRDTARFFLVVGECPTYDVLGWVFGYEGKDEKHWRTGTGRPAFFVPQSALRPFTPTTAAVAA